MDLYDLVLLSDLIGQEDSTGGWFPRIPFTGKRGEEKEKA